MMMPQNKRRSLGCGEPGGRTCQGPGVRPSFEGGRAMKNLASGTNQPPASRDSSAPLQPANGTKAEGWRTNNRQPSLVEVFRTVKVPGSTASVWRKFLAFSGPGYLVAVGYMDPGNWATSLAGGSAFGYTLLSVIMLSNLMAILLQGLALKLGVVAERDLAQACRD